MSIRSLLDDFPPLRRLRGVVDPRGLKPGDALGRFRILQILPRGGMGIAFRAHDPLLRRDVVLKLLRPDRRLRVSQALFLREARLASLAAHPNVVTIYDLWRRGRHQILVMEYVGTRSLRAVIADGPMDAKTALSHSLQIVAGLAHLHGLGIVHRDLKPSNLILSPAGEIKIVDFGISRFIPIPDALTLPQSNETGPATEGLVLGTPCYMAPEQIQQLDVDGRTDLFSFGCVLFEMLTGHIAFDSTSWENIRRRILLGEPEWPREPFGDVRDAMRSIADRCLRKKPAERWQSAADLEKALLECWQRSEIAGTEAEGVAHLWRELLVAQTPEALDDLRTRVAGEIDRDPDSLELRRLMGRIERLLSPEYSSMPRLSSPLGEDRRDLRRQVVVTLASIAGVVVVAVLGVSLTQRLSRPRGPDVAGSGLIVAGRVVSSSGGPVPGALVTIDGHDFMTRTASDGEFRALFTDVDSGETVRLRVTHDTLATYTGLVRADSAGLGGLRIEMQGVRDE